MKGINLLLHLFGLFCFVQFSFVFVHLHLRDSFGQYCVLDFQRLYAVFKDFHLLGIFDFRSVSFGRIVRFSFGLIRLVGRIIFVRSVFVRGLEVFPHSI